VPKFPMAAFMGVATIRYPATSLCWTHGLISMASISGLACWCIASLSENNDRSTKRLDMSLYVQPSFFVSWFGGSQKSGRIGKEIREECSNYLAGSVDSQGQAGFGPRIVNSCVHAVAKNEAVLSSAEVVSYDVPAIVDSVSERVNVIAREVEGRIL